MDWTKDLKDLLDNCAKRLNNVKKTFEEDAEDFDNVLVKRGGPMIRTKLRSTPEEAKKFDISSERGRFLLKREAMLEDALEGR